MKLIQSRDSFKNIIDIFSKAFQITQNKTYIDKVTFIKKKINQSKLVKVKRDEIINFFDKIYFDLQFSNRIAHTIDIEKSILEQIFIHIDPKKKLSNARDQLEKGKLNYLLKELALNRNNFLMIN